MFDELLFKIVFYFLISWISSINIRYSQLHSRRRHSFLKNGSTPTHLCALVGVSFARIIPELSANHIFMASFVSWLVAQVAKLFTNCYRKGKWELKVMFDSGGMPSSHTSLVFFLEPSSFGKDKLLARKGFFHCTSMEFTSARNK